MTTVYDEMTALVLIYQTFISILWLSNTLWCSSFSPFIKYLYEYHYTMFPMKENNCHMILPYEKELLSHDFTITTICKQIVVKSY
jgi:hypothetical protein